MLNLSAFNHNHHASRVKMVAKFIRRGIRVEANACPRWLVYSVDAFVWKEERLNHNEE